MRGQRSIQGVAAAALLAGSAASLPAALVNTQADNNPAATNVVDDGVISPGEYSASYNNGGGGGFGGTLGAGTLHFDADSTNLYIGFVPGNNLNDLVSLQLDTRSGGFVDADMNDTADGGRRAVSNLAGAADDAFPFLSDFGVAIASFGTVVFELNAGNTPGHLTFHLFEGDQTTNSPTVAREFEIPLALLGNPTQVDFFAGYVADGGFGSNESLPASGGLNGGSNVGDGTTSPGYENFNRFVIVPEPATAGVLALGGLAVLARRRRA